MGFDVSMDARRDWIKLRISQLKKVRAQAQGQIQLLVEEIDQYDYEISLLNQMLGDEPL